VKGRLLEKTTFLRAAQLLIEAAASGTAANLTITAPGPQAQASEQYAAGAPTKRLRTVATTV